MIWVSGPARSGRSILTDLAEIRKGEYISGIFVRAGARIEAFQILTSLGRKSPLFGNALAGTP